MTRMTLGKAIALAALGFCVGATAADLPTRHVLTLNAARQVIAAAERQALQKGWPCVVAVTDEAGYLIALDRMDGSPMLASVELAPAKARTAALFQPGLGRRHSRGAGGRRDRRLCGDVRRPAIDGRWRTDRRGRRQLGATRLGRPDRRCRRCCAGRQALTGRRALIASRCRAPLEEHTPSSARRRVVRPDDFLCVPGLHRILGKSDETRVAVREQLGEQVNRKRHDEQKESEEDHADNDGGDGHDGELRCDVRTRGEASANGNNCCPLAFARPECGFFPYSGRMREGTRGARHPRVLRHPGHGCERVVAACYIPP